MAFLQTEGLTFSYRNSEKKALNGVGFSIEKGELMLLYGSSGSGKSTLLRLLKPELAPSGELSGSILFCGKDISQLSAAESAEEIGYVGQDPNASPVTENVLGELAFLLENLGKPRSFIMRRIAELSAYLGLESLIDKKISELSAGQKQLVNLAAVLTASPSLLLLDEPTSQLDPHSAEILRSRLMKIRSELGTAMIVCEHDAEGLFGNCGKVLYLEKGDQRFLLPPEKAAEALSDKPMGKGLPCGYRLSAALGLEKPFADTSSARKYLLDNYPPAHIITIGAVSEESKAETAVELKNVRFRYTKHGRDILRGAELSVKKGSITAVCGANGTGKSTLLKLIAGVYGAYDGRIKLFGKAIGSYRGGSLYRGTLAMLPQDPSCLFTEKTVRDDLRISPDGERRSDVEIISAVQRLGLSEELLGRFHLDLSGGELQRAALVKLMLNSPKLLLLDEPEKGLDCMNKRLLTDFLKKFSGNGGTVIFVTHDLDFAAETADEAIMMFGGMCAVREDIVDFLSENELYTTAASRISKGIFDGTVTTERLISRCVKAGDGGK